MSEPADHNVAKFLNDILLTKNASVKKFEQALPELKFDGSNALAWQFVVLKALEPDFANFLPLAHHLLDYNYCVVEGPMVKYAALNGYKIESGLAAMQKPLDEVNKITQDCGFTEKLVVKNQPAEDILDLATKIVRHSNDNDYNEVKDILVKAGVNLSHSKLMQRPTVSTSLKI